VIILLYLMMVDTMLNTSFVSAVYLCLLIFGLMIKECCFLFCVCGKSCLLLCGFMCFFFLFFCLLFTNYVLGLVYLITTVLIIFFKNFSTISDTNRLRCATILAPDTFDFFHNIHSVNNTSKDDMFAIQPISFHCA